MIVKKNDILFFIGILCALWFVLGGMVWTYNAALIVAYPVGLISFIIWRSIRSENKRRTILIPIILSIGFVLSITVLIYLLIWG